VTESRERRNADGVRRRDVCRELWAGLLTWVAFRVVVTAAVTFAGSAPSSGPDPLPLSLR